MAEMTKDVCCKIQKDKGFYRQPALNDVLYLHYKGFAQIAGLEEFVNAKCAWLEGNAFEDIGGLDNLVELRSLYLQENMIKQISNLSNLRNLVSLNLSNNFITKIEGLSQLTKLTQLQIKQNRLKDYASLEHLLECPSIQSLDLTDNKIDDERAVDLFASMQGLLSLYCHKNPFTGKIKPYRKTIVGQCKNLKYLDERPVFADERREVTAYMRGGIEAEREESKLIRQEKEAARQRERDEFNKLRGQWAQERLEREARGEMPEPTEYYKNNHMNPTEEDQWFTEHRELMKAGMPEEQRREREQQLYAHIRDPENNRLRPTPAAARGIGSAQGGRLPLDIPHPRVLPRHSAVELPGPNGASDHDGWRRVDPADPIMQRPSPPAEHRSQPVDEDRDDGSPGPELTLEDEEYWLGSKELQKRREENRLRGKEREERLVAADEEAERRQQGEVTTPKPHPTSDVPSPTSTVATSVGPPTSASAEAQRHADPFADPTPASPHHPLVEPSVSSCGEQRSCAAPYRRPATAAPARAVAAGEASGRPMVFGTKKYSELWQMATADDANGTSDPAEPSAETDTDANAASSEATERNTNLAELD